MNLRASLRHILRDTPQPKPRLKLRVWLLSLFVVALAATGCQESEAAIPTPRPDTGHLTLWRWETTPEEALATQQQVDAFIEANPAISVTVENVAEYGFAMRQAFIAGTMPDLLLLDGPLAKELQQAAGLVPLQALLTAPEEFHPVLREMFGNEGNLWCAPRDVHTLALAYNPTLFGDDPASYPASAWGWAELRAAADATTNLEQGVFGMSLPADVTRWLPFVHSAGGSLPIEERGATTFAAPGIEEALTWFTSFGAEDVSAEPIDVQSTWAGEAFAHQRAAMVIEGSWVVKWFEENFAPVIVLPHGVNLPGLAVAYAELPTGPAGKSTLAFGTCYGVSTHSANPLAAARLADALTSGTSAELWANVSGSLPARQPLAERFLAAKPAFAPFIAALEYAVPWTVSARWQPLIDLLNGETQDLFYAETTSAEVLAEADALYLVMTGQ